MLENNLMIKRRDSGGYGADTRLLMRFDNNFKDEAGSIPKTTSSTPSGFSTTRKFGETSYSADSGSGLYFPIDAPRFVNGITEATFEVWLYHLPISTWAPLLSQTNDNYGLDMSPTDGHDLAIQYKNESGVRARVKLIEVGDLLRSVWLHLAVVWKDGYVQCYVNGKKKLGGLMPFWCLQPNAIINVGFYGYSPTYRYRGLIDEMRLLSKAIYLDEFTPPATPFVL